MERIKLYFITATLIAFAAIQNVSAQLVEDIPWENYATNVNTISADENDGNYLLYNVQKKLFLSAGGVFGVEGTLAENGMYFKISNKNGTLTLRCEIENEVQGPYLGNNGNGVTFEGIVAFDRPSAEVRSQWTAEKVGDAETDYKYKLHNNNNNGEDPWYLKAEESQKVVFTQTESEGDEWRFIKRETFFTVILKQTKQERIDVTGLVDNGRFLRNVDKEDNLWIPLKPEGEGESDEDKLEKGTAEIDEDLPYSISINPEFGSKTESDSYANAYGAFGCAELSAKGRIRQRIDGLYPGLYEVRVQGFFYDENDAEAASNTYLFVGHKGMVLPTLDASEREDFKALIAKHKDAIKALTSTQGIDYPNKYRSNVPAAEFLAGGTKDTEGDRYKEKLTTKQIVAYAVLEKDDLDSEGKGTLGVGIAKMGDNGRAYIDNVELYYLGNYEFGIDAYSTNPEIDKKAYKYERRFNLRRSFAPNKWNAIVLPVDLTCNQVLYGFGRPSISEAKLSELVGIEGTKIVFKPVDLTKGDEIALHAGKCYVIYVTKKPDVTEGNYEFQRLEGKVTYDAPVYHINGVGRKDEVANAIPKNGIVTETNIGGLDFTGYYYRPTSAPAGSYIVTGGNMYHLQNDWTSLMGTCWTLEETNDSSTKQLTFSFGDDETTDIQGILTEDGVIEDMTGNIYNLNGQKVSSANAAGNLPKGVYIKNGKKFVVK